MQNIAFLLDNIWSPINLGYVLRTCRIFQHKKVYLYDPKNIFKTKYKKIYDFSCGAVAELKLEHIRDLDEFLKNYRAGRKIATYLDPTSSPLKSFRFRPGDLVIFGNEYAGISRSSAKHSEARLIIELPSGQYPKPKNFLPISSKAGRIRKEGAPSLGVAASVAVIAYKIFVQKTRT